MTNIINTLLKYIKQLHKEKSQLLYFIAKFIPLRQLAFDDSKSPKYQKFKVDKLPTIIRRETYDYLFLIELFQHKYNKKVAPIKRHKPSMIPEDLCCPRCNAPHDYLYNNNGKMGQFLCSVCSERFNRNNYQSKELILKCPYCNHTLEAIKERKAFTIHKCKNKKCSFYLNNKRSVPPETTHDERSKYKLHYIYREFDLSFFTMELDSLPKQASSLKFNKQSAHIMGLCLTYHVNLGLSLRVTSRALNEIHGVCVSHTMVANYAKTAAVLVKPFIDNYDYKPSNELTADETYIKVKGVKSYIWFIMDAVSRSILGYQVSDNRSVVPCILTMRMAFNKYKEFPKKLIFVADGYSAYPLAAQGFAKLKKKFSVTQVIGLTNEDAVSKEFRSYKQIVERLNRTFKHSYRPTCGYDNLNGAAYGVTLWVGYYNFLRPHSTYKNNRPLNSVAGLEAIPTMPGKWQMLLLLGQQQILDLQVKSQR